MQTDAHKLRPIITIATGSNLVLNYKTAVRQRFFGDSSRRRNIVKAKQKHNDWKLFNLVYVEVSAQCLCLFRQVLTSCCKKKKSSIYMWQLYRSGYLCWLLRCGNNNMMPGTGQVTCTRKTCLLYVVLVALVHEGKLYIKQGTEIHVQQLKHICEYWV